MSSGQDVVCSLCTCPPMLQLLAPWWHVPTRPMMPHDHSRVIGISTPWKWTGVERPLMGQKVPAMPSYY